MTELRRRRAQRAAGPPRTDAPSSAGAEPRPATAGAPAVSPDLTPGHAAGCRRPPPLPVWWAHPAGGFAPLWRCVSCGAAWPRAAS